MKKKFYFIFLLFCVIAEAGAGAGEKAPAPGCCFVAKGYCGGKLSTILIKFCHFLTIYTQIEGKK